MIVTVLCVILTVRGVCATGTKEAAVRDLFREMLHIQPPSARGPSKPLAAPRHMLELYQQYTTKGPAEDATTTVRNILPITGSAGDKALLYFNASCVQPQEDVRLAHLHLNRRRLHQRHHHSRRLLAPPYRVRLYHVSPRKLVPLASVPVSMVQKSAWGVVDITAALRELLLYPRASGHLLAVRFESPSGKPIPPLHFLRGVTDTYAFLMVFTEDTEDSEVSESSPKPPIHTHAMVQKLQQGQHGKLFREEQDNFPQIIPLFEEVKERRIFTRNNTSSMIKQLTTIPRANLEKIETLSNLEAFEEQPLRKARSIIDNQLPDDDDTQAPKSSLEPILTTRTDLLRYPGGSGRKPKTEKKVKRKRGRKQKYYSSQVLWQNVYQNPEEVPGACTVRKMTVNFSEIGWGEWIIAPDKFDANYCTGSCRFPLTKALKPSNHAALQSLVHALGHNPLVPAPACVPHHMSAITLLYVDETLNVVIKNYPSMIVDSCACR